jgi:hypothetical protein
MHGGVDPGGMQGTLESVETPTNCRSGVAEAACALVDAVSKDPP